MSYEEIFIPADLCILSDKTASVLSSWFMWDGCSVLSTGMPGM